MFVGISMSEEDERFERENEPNYDIVWVDGKALIESTYSIRKPIKTIFPFSALIQGRQQHMKKVFEELKKRQPSFPQAVNGFPFEIFIIDFINIKPDEDDCESE